MKPVFFFLFMFIRTAIPVIAQEQQVVTYTLADRDRGIRTEIKLESLEVKMDTKFDAVNSRIDYLFWMQGFIVALMLFIFGYIIRDRRTELKPALVKAQLADIKCNSILTMLRDYAKENKELSNFLRTHGLL